jgi:hypothetical protein
MTLTTASPGERGSRSPPSRLSPGMTGSSQRGLSLAAGQRPMRSPSRRVRSRPLSLRCTGAAVAGADSETSHACAEAKAGRADPAVAGPANRQQQVRGVGRLGLAGICRNAGASNHASCQERRAIVASLGAPGSVRPSLGVAPNASKRVALRHESPAPVSGRKHPTARAFGPPDLSRNSERSHESRSPHPPAVRPICNLSATGLFLRRRHARFPCTKREGSLDVMATKNPAFVGLS